MKDVKYLRAPEIFHSWDPTSVTFPGPWCWPDSGLDTQLTRTHWCQLDTSRNWFSALSPTSLLSNLKLSLSQSLFWDMYVWIPHIRHFSTVQFKMHPPCLCVRPDVDMSLRLAEMYQVSPRHHYVCIFTNVKILHNMSGTDSGDTPSVHPEPSPGHREHKSS